MDVPVFTSKDFADHEQVVFGTDHASGLKAIIAIHNTNLGPGLGGCRMWPYESEEAAISDVLRLSRGMTYKNAVANLPFGGGKSVIIGDSKKDKSEALLRAMGRFIDSLGGRYITAEDVGTTVTDMDHMRQETEYARGWSDGSGNPSPATAWGVFSGIRAAVTHRFRRNSVGGLKVAVQGLGNVGRKLCDFLAQDGAELFVADINETAVERAIRDYGARDVGTDEIIGLEADLFAPCALGGVINDETIPRLKAPIVAGATNNQLTALRHGEALHARGILYAPDYVINAGGVIDIAHEGPDYNPDKVLEQAGGIYDTILNIFRRAEEASLPPHIIADRIAEERFQRV